MIEPFVITQEDSDCTGSDTTADSLQDVYSYRVPIGVTIILRPTDVLCVGIEETDGTVAQNISLVKLEKRDQTGEEKMPLVNSMQFANFAASGVGEFQDEDKLVRLEINKELRVEEQEYIVLMAKNASPYIGEDDSYFELRCHRER